MPSYSELTAVVGFRSKHAAYQLVQRLVAHEWVEKDAQGESSGQGETGRLLGYNDNADEGKQSRIQGAYQMIPELIAAAQSVKVLNDLVQAGFNLHTFNQVVTALSKVNADLLSAQTAALKSQEEQAQLAKKVRALEEQLAAAAQWDTIAQRYKLKALVPEVFVHEHVALSPEAEPSHFACANCFERKERSILQCVASDESGKTYECSRCKARINADNPHYQPVTQYARGTGNPLLRH